MLAYEHQLSYIVSIPYKIVDFFRNIIMGTEMMQAAAPVVEPLVTPLLQNFAKKCRIAYKDLMIPRAEHFQKYLKRKYDDFNIITTLVFHNAQRKLKEIYVAQSLVKYNYFAEKEITKIDKFPTSLINKYKKILIEDTAGMGKSTIMKFMFVELCDQGLKDVGIPIFVELNKLTETHTILDEIQKELNPLSEKFDKDMLLYFIETGGFIFFLDGFDEISPSGEEKVKVVEDIKNFISKAGKDNYFLLTSRADDQLSGFGDFQGFSIKNLSKEEAYELLKKYDLSSNKVVSSNLVSELITGNYPSLDDFLVNPLLVSLLFTAYDYNQIIPLEKHRFYSNVFEAYFEKHDSLKTMKSRVKFSGLNYDGFYRVLRYVGFDCLKILGVRFSKEQILDSIGRAKAFCGNLDFSASDFLKDMVTSVPLFCHDGNNYKWVHKSLMEYFAANFILFDAKENQGSILTAIYKSGRFEHYFNMLDIYYDIDYYGFSKNLILPFCNDYLSFYKSYFVALNINKGLIEKRLGLLFVYLFRNKPYRGKAKISTGAKNLKDLHEYFIRSQSFTNRFFHIKYDIGYILYKKKSSLIRFYESDYPPYNNSANQENECETIEIKSGSFNESFYSKINDCMNLPYYPDYTACKNEVKKIQSKIKKSNSGSDLLSGI